MLADIVLWTAVGCTWIAVVVSWFVGRRNRRIMALHRDQAIAAYKAAKDLYEASKPLSVPMPNLVVTIPDRVSEEEAEEFRRRFMEATQSNQCLPMPMIDPVIVPRKDDAILLEAYSMDPDHVIVFGETGDGATDWRAIPTRETSK